MKTDKSISSENEGAWLLALPNECKARFLSQLAHLITVSARDTYEAGTERVIKPEQLRRINEIQHRITACLRDVIAENVEASFVESTAQCALVNSDEELNDSMTWSWLTAKDRCSAKS
jgi:hypothetical protein